MQLLYYMLINVAKFVTCAKRNEGEVNAYASNIYKEI